MKVIIGVDGSPHTEATLEFVRKMSWAPDTQVVVASAVQLPLGAYSETYAPVAVDMTVWLEELTKMHQALVSKAARTLSDAGLRTQERVLQGDPRETLIDEAKQQKADLLVVGSHGRTGIEKLFMGSVATHVVTHAPCSVLVVRRGASGGR